MVRAPLCTESRCTTCNVCVLVTNHSMLQDLLHQVIIVVSVSLCSYMMSDSQSLKHHIDVKCYICEVFISNISDR